MDIFLDEHKEFLLLLLKHEVEFMLIGGYAVIFYGYERTTGDMDIWLKPTNENKVKFIEVLKSYGINEEHIKAAKEMNFEEAQMMHIGERPKRIDFLTKVYGLTYNEADEKKVLLPLKDQFVPVIDYHHLVIVKMFAGRPQDKADIDILQKIRNNKK